MATIAEDYVSFEIAKLLKDKGFDTAVRHYYQKIDDDITHHIEDFRNWNVYNMWYSIPTLQMAMKWLREVYKIHVVIYPYGDYSCDNYQFDVYKEGNLVVSKDDGYITYEEACEAAIKYCLENLI